MSLLYGALAGTPHIDTEATRPILPVVPGEVLPYHWTRINSTRLARARLCARRLVSLTSGEFAQHVMWPVRELGDVETVARI
jgi:hypothetical protein